MTKRRWEIIVGMSMLGLGVSSIGGFIYIVGGGEGVKLALAIAGCLLWVGLTVGCIVLGCSLLEGFDE